MAGFKTHMLNFHDDDDIVKSFFCLDILGTPDICRKETLEAPFIANVAETTSYDEIAVEAKEIGLLNGIDISRSATRKLLQEYFESEQGIREADLPSVCVEGRALNLLEQISIVSESSGLPEYYAKRGEVELSNRFEEYKVTKFCSVNTRDVLLEHGAAIRAHLLNQPVEVSSV